MCDEQVHTLHCAHHNVYSKYSVLFCALLYALCTHLLCLPFFFFSLKVSSVFVKMTTNKKHKFQFRKKATNQNQKKKKKNNTEYVDETRREKRTTNGDEHHKRFDTIIYHSKLLLFSRYLLAWEQCIGVAHTLATVLCVQCSLFLKLIVHISDKRCLYSVIVNCFFFFFRFEAVFVLFRLVLALGFIGIIFAFFSCILLISSSVFFSVFSILSLLLVLRSCFFFFEIIYFFLFFHFLRFIIRS